MMSRMTAGLLLVKYSVLLGVMCLMCCFAANQDASFDNFNNCDHTYNIDRTSQVLLTAERSGSSVSNSFSSCVIQFKASSVNDRLCVKIEKLEFKNTNLALNYYHSLDPTNVAPDKTFRLNGDPFSVPSEFCSEGREISLELKGLVPSASIRDVEIDIRVHNMQGNTRTGYMDRDCGTTFDIDNSTISVLNRLSIPPVTPLPTPCQLYFEYTGLHPNYTVCLFFMRHSDSCGYRLKVFDGTPASHVAAQIYSCTNEQPQTWCADKKAFYLELDRDDVNTAESDMFSVQVKDGEKGSTTFPVDDGSPGPVIPIYAIVIIVVAVILVIVAIIVFFLKKSKG